MPTRGERLQLLGWLLAAPAEDARELLHELRDQQPWLQDSLPELDAVPLEEWQAEHTRLFVNGHPRTACPPFESVWVNGMMSGPATASIADLYRRIGLESEHLLPDYLGTMLECASYLEEQPDEPACALRRELWEEHLGRWLPQFTQALLKESRLALYRDLAGQLSALYEDRCA